MRRWRRQLVHLLVLCYSSVVCGIGLQLDAVSRSGLTSNDTQDELAAQLTAAGVHRHSSGEVRTDEPQTKAPPQNAAVKLFSAKTAANASADASIVEEMPHLPEHGLVATLIRQLSVPVASLCIGAVLRCAVPRQALLPHLLMFFGAQTFMNIYMKAILSDAVISARLNMRGFQGPLILTALQQLVTFACLWTIVALSHLTPFPYKPRRLSRGSEVLTVFCLALFFSANIALNNFSLSLLDLSASVVIRSLSPLSALILQLLFAGWFDREALGMQPPKLLLMMAGVACALVTVMAKYHDEGPARSSHYGLGLALCGSSVVASSMELVVVVIIGKGMQMNSLDTILYMSLPAFVLIFCPAVYLRHPVSYPYHAPSTDWEIFQEVWNMKFVTIVLILLSGVFALVYNLLLYMTVRNLSPLYATFAGNFNKVASIGFSLFLGFEKLPPMPWSIIMGLGVLGNVAAFTGYSLWPKAPPMKKRALAKR